MKKEISWSVILVSFFTVMIGGIALAGSIVFVQAKAKVNSVQTNNNNNIPQSAVSENNGTSTNSAATQESSPTTQSNPAAPQEEVAVSQDTTTIKSSALPSSGTESSYTNGSTTTFDHIEEGSAYPNESQPTGDVNISARIDDSSPEQGYTTRLIVSGPKGGVVTAVCPVKAQPKTYYARLSYITGKAIIPIKTKDTFKGEKVVIDVTVNYNDHDYKTTATIDVRK